MVRVKINKKAGYASAIALTLALTPLVLALPAVAEPCGTIGGVIPVLICPPAPTRPVASPTPSPTASSTAPPTTTPVVPPAQPPATPGPTPAAGRQATVAPAADPGAVSPPAAPAVPALPTATPSGNPGATAAPKTSEEEDGSVPGALLLALGGLLMTGWAAISLRRPA